MKMIVPPMRRTRLHESWEPHGTARSHSIFSDMTAQQQCRLSFAAKASRFLALAFVALTLFVAPARVAAAIEKTAEHEKVASAHEAPAAAHGAGAAEEHHGISPDAPRIQGSFINSSMLVTWIVAGLIIFFAQRATRKIRQSPEAAFVAPTGAQNFWEFLVEGLRNFLEEIIGPDLAKKTFWFFATVFIFILFTNWFGLLPGVGTIGWGTPEADGTLKHIATPLLRGGNADLNMTFAISSIFFVLWVVWALQFNGFVGFVKHLFAPKGESQGAMKVMLIIVFLAVGSLEVISIAFRPVSLSFRLFGNIFAGENLLESMQNVVPALGWLIPLPFYFMELLVGLVQALVFMLLTAVFTLLICSHDEEHAHEEGHASH